MFWCMLELVWKWEWKTCCRSLSTALLLITCVTFLIEKKSYTTLWSWFLLPQFSICFVHPNPHPFFLHLWNKKASKTPNKPDFYKKIKKKHNTCLQKVHKNTNMENILYMQKTRIPKHSNMRQMSKNIIIEFMFMGHPLLDMGSNLKSS